jgi:hypothetical protein
MNDRATQGGEMQPLYTPQRAIEKILALPDFMPVRLFAVLFPLWEVEVSGRYEQGRPYELIEKYIERGMVEAQLTTPHDLAEFFGLQESLVEKVLNFLETIMHVTRQNGRLVPTPLAWQSVQAGEKYIPKETRRKLYFDGFRSQPLTSAHYHRVRILSPYEADTLSDSYQAGYQFQRLYSFAGWNPQAVSELGQQSDRAEYNVPDEVHHLTQLNLNNAYLPMYIIETRRRAAPTTPYYVVYTRIRNLRDEFFERLINSSPEMRKPLYNEFEHPVNELWRKWLSEMGVTDVAARQLANGLWRVTLTPQALRSSQVRLNVASIGTYHLERGYFLHIWCDDEPLRRRAVLDRIIKILKSRKHAATQQDIQELLQRFRVQLQVSDCTLSDLLERARETGMSDLVKQLDEFSKA